MTPTQTHAALLSEAIKRLLKAHRITTQAPPKTVMEAESQIAEIQNAVKFAEEALLAKLQPAQEPAQAGELPDEREALIDDLAKWEMRVRRYVTASPSRPLSAKGIDMTHPEFNVAEWRKHSILHNIIVKLFCRHKHTTEIAAIEHEHLGDKQPYNRFWMPAVVVEKCCRCGHISAQHVWTTRDRSPGAVARAMGFLE